MQMSNLLRTFVVWSRLADKSGRPMWSFKAHLRSDPCGCPAGAVSQMNFDKTRRVLSDVKSSFA